MPVRRRRFEDKRSRSEVISVRGEGSSRQQVLTLDKLLSRWGASARFSSDVASSKPSIQVEGRGHGMAVVQLRTSYYTTSVRRLRQDDSRRRVGFDLEPRVELAGKNNTTEFKILSCQR